MKARVSVRDIAKATGLSKTTVGYALANHTGVSKATRERVARIARELGYAPDARVASSMKAVREAKTKDLLPLAWLSTEGEKIAWQKYKFLSPYLAGAEEAAARFGYRLEQIWGLDPGTTMRGISRMLYHRGIEGVIITQSARHFRLKLDRMAVVAMEGSLLAPRVNQIRTDEVYNLLLALKMVKRAGYRRIGVCLEEKLDQYSRHGVRAATHHFLSMLPRAQRVEPCFYHQLFPGRPPLVDPWPLARKQVAKWLGTHRPDVVVGHTNWLVDVVEEAGFRVPENIGVVHTATDDDVSDWAGVYSNRRKIGATAVTSVISDLQNSQFGVPEIPIHSLIQGKWHPGQTLLMPKPK